MSEEVKINKQANSITFTNNNISFSQFGIAKEILDLIENQQSEIERLNNIINELENILKDLIFGSNNLNHKLTAQIILMRLKELKGSDKE